MANVGLHEGSHRFHDHVHRQRDLLLVRQFCLYAHDNIETRRKNRQYALDHDHRLFLCTSANHQCTRSLSQGRWLSLILISFPTDDKAVTLRSRFSVTGREAEYPDTINSDYLDFGKAYGTYRR